MWKFFKKIARSLVNFSKFAGFKYYCPFCEKHARIFTPISFYPGQRTIDRYQIIAMGANPHYRCPWCNSSDKERLVWKYLTAKTDILPAIGIFPCCIWRPRKTPEKNFKQGRILNTYTVTCLRVTQNTRRNIMAERCILT